MREIESIMNLHHDSDNGPDCPDYPTIEYNPYKKKLLPNDATKVCSENWEVFSIAEKTGHDWDFIEECFEAYQEGENKIVLPCLHEEAVIFADFCRDCAEANCEEEDFWIDERMN